MTIANLPSSLKDQDKAQWIKSDLKQRLVDCVDQIIHFFVIRSLQIDLTSHTQLEK